MASSQIKDLKKMDTKQSDGKTEELILRGKKSSTEGELFITIYDWDDTLLPTYHLETLGHVFGEKAEQMSDELIEKLRILSIHVESILQKSLDKGSVYIVTNSENGWVDKSIKRYYPKLILNTKITVISARQYSEKDEIDPIKWKSLAFDKLLSAYPVFVTKHVVCIGDSDVERIAIKKSTSEMPLVISKIIKLCDKPDVDKVLDQFKYISENLSSIYSEKKEFEIAIHAKPIPPLKLDSAKQ